MQATCAIRVLVVGQGSAPVRRSDMRRRACIAVSGTKY
jgi:hypothetical protein